MHIIYLLYLIPLAAHYTVAQPADPLADPLTTCLLSLPYRVVLPTSPAYAAASKAYNRRLTIRPLAIAYPLTAAHVAAAVLCASASGTPVVARSGGHSAAGFSLGGTDGSVVVDLAGLDGVAFGEGEGEGGQGTTITVGTGLRLGDVARALQGVGRALPHGTCPTVGVGGHAGFGGFGFASREWGLLLDRMVRAEVVVADGRIVNASLTENPDLFWAIRGAVASFGIATSYTFATLPEPPVTTAYSYVFSGPASAAAQCLLAFQAFAATSAPAPLGMQFSIIPDLTYELFGSYTGPKRTFEALFQPLVRECEQTSDDGAAGTHAFAHEMGWEASRVGQAGTPPRVADCFYAKSLMTAASAPLSLSTIAAFVGYLHAEAPRHALAWFVEVDVYGGAGSAINAVPRNITAFAHRDRLLGIHMKASSRDLRPPFPQSAYAFVGGMERALRSGPERESKSFAAYGSYVDPLLRAEEWKALYYGEETYARLRGVKAEWDPRGVFSFPQVIEGVDEIGNEGRRVVDEL